MHKTGNKRGRSRAHTHTHTAHMNIITQYIYMHVLCLYMYTYTSSSVRTNGLIARDPTFGGVPSLAAATRTQNINK